MRRWVLVLVGAFLCACSKAPSLVGQWTGTIKGFDATIEFKEDNTFLIKGSNAGYDFEISGDYKKEEKRLTLTPGKVDVKGVPEEYKQVVDAFTKDLVNKPFGGDIEFKSDEELNWKFNLIKADAKPTDPKAATTATTKTATPPADETTLRRKKVKA